LDNSVTDIIKKVYNIFFVAPNKILLLLLICLRIGHIVDKPASIKSIVLLNLKYLIFKTILYGF
jgi:hypothetical protein